MRPNYLPRSRPTQCRPFYAAAGAFLWEWRFVCYVLAFAYGFFSCPR
jgi:hypothetical protein